jgi:hypothetical protein
MRKTRRKTKLAHGCTFLRSNTLTLGTPPRHVGAVAKIEATRMQLNALLKQMQRIRRVLRDALIAPYFLSPAILRHGWRANASGRRL